MKLLLLFLFLMNFSFAHENDITHRPKSFSFGAGKAVFVDFEEANYKITYDIKAKSAQVHAKIKLHVIEEGFPVFDLIENPTSVSIDGQSTSSTVIATPDDETQVRVINQSLKAGKYEVEIRVPLTNLVKFEDSGVKSAFWVTDLEDRYYLERYIPVNLEYDRVKMTFALEFKNATVEQHLFSNGTIKKLTKKQGVIEFPEHFTVNSLYFHTTPVGTVHLLETSFKSVNGSELPVKIYTAKAGNAQGTVDGLKNLALKTFNELEKDYGAFPHQSITIYNADLSGMGLGGMEYAGATVTDKSALSHELFHSYFARGVVPANGNAGWIDESLASWRDNGYNRIGSLMGSSDMANHPAYTRKTDTAAYGFGARFMAFLDNKFSSKGGLKPFMNKLLEKKLFEPIFTEEFIQEMESFYGEDLKAVFKTYVYKNGSAKSVLTSEKSKHRKLSHQELLRIL